jgi:surface protein
MTGVRVAMAMVVVVMVVVMDAFGLGCVGGARGRVGALTFAFALASISRAYGQYSPFTTRNYLKTAVDACTGSMVGCTDGNTPPVSIENWDVSGVDDMNNLFGGKSAFNADISGWNVAAVTKMDFMFQSATAFNQDIGSWNVARVTSLRGMFNRATAFNQDVSSWNVAAVTTMYLMFEDATAFNQDISRWNVATVADMMYMFQGATAFNQDITGWETTAIDAARSSSSIASMFSGATAWAASYEQTQTPMWDNVYDGPPSRWRAIGGSPGGSPGSPGGSPGASNATADGESYPDWVVGLTSFTFALSATQAVILLYRTVRAKNRAGNVAAQMRILPNAPLSPPPPQTRQNVAAPGTVVVQMR